MITVQNIIKHELIGMDTQVVESKNSTIAGLAGKIVDETRSMFVLKTASGQKMIPKQHNKWKFTLDTQDIIIDGNSISKRPEDRIKVKA